MMRYVLRLAALAAALSGAACATMGIEPAPAAAPAPEALVVLPGFGFGADGQRALAAIAAPAAAARLDLYVPAYVSRGGLAESRSNLRRFIREERLDRYQRVHVFAFIAGGWTFNPLADAGALPNLATVVYDRSPFQERAPRIAAARLPFLTWLRHGSTVADVANSPYTPLTAPGVKIGLMVETKPTAFVRRFARTARGFGPYRFECDSFAQRHDDCLYLAMDHGAVYGRFAEVWPDLLAFIRTGRFTSAADRTPPAVEDIGAGR
jgi:hypothetical protein